MSRGFDSVAAQFDAMDECRHWESDMLERAWKHDCAYRKFLWEEYSYYLPVPRFKTFEEVMGYKPRDSYYNRR